MENLTTSQTRQLRIIGRILNTPELTESQLKTLNEFDDRNKGIRRIKPQTRLNYLKVLQLLGRETKKNYKNMLPEDITKFISGRNHLKDNTINNYKIGFTNFFEWLKKNDIIDALKEIKIFKNGKNGFISRQDLLTDEELKKMIDIAPRLRDKIIILLISETGLRADEAVNLRIGDIEFKGDYGELTVRISKTDQRTIPFIKSVPLLQQHIDLHPFKEDKSSFLFLTDTTNHKNKPFLPVRIYYIVKAAAKRAGITKRVWAHQLRHIAATNYLKMGMGEAMAKKLLGLSSNSDMLARYGHLVSGDAINTLKQNAGMDIKQEKENSVLNVKVCPRCNTNNHYNSKHCSKCWLPLDVKIAMEQKDSEIEVRSFMELVMKELPVEKLKELMQKVT
jgi:integrase/recombinase XerD